MKTPLTAAVVATALFAVVLVYTPGNIRGYTGI